MKLKDINKKEFEDFCKQQECDNFFQSKYYAEIKRLEGYHTYFVGLEDNGRILGATLLLAKQISIFKKREFYAPRGFIIDYKNFDLLKEFVTQLVEYVKLKKGVFIKINPLITLQDRDKKGKIIEGGNNNIKIVEELKNLGWHQESNELLYPKEENILYTLDLTNKTYEELFENFSDNMKTMIRKNENMGISTRKIDKTNISRLIDILDGSSYVSDHLLINHGNYQEISNILTNHDILDITVAELDIDKYTEYINSINSEDKEKKIEIAKKLQYEYGHKVLLGLILGVIYNNKYYVLTHAINKTIEDFDSLISLYSETIKECSEKEITTYSIYEIGNNIENNKMLEKIKGFNGNIVELIGEFNYIIDERYYKKNMNKQKKAYLN